MSLVNTKQLDDMAKQIEQIPDCRALEELIVKLEEMIKAQLEAMLQQIADLAELALPPTSLKKLIKWYNVNPQLLNFKFNVILFFVYLKVH